MQSLRDKFQMVHHLPGRRCCRRHHIVIFAQPRGGAVIHHMAILPQHQPIADFANLQGGEHVRIHKVEQFGRVRPLNIDFAKGRDITNAHGTADIANLPITALPPGRLPRLGEIAGAIPEARFNHRRATFFGGDMRGCLAFRCKAFAFGVGSHRGNRNGCIGWAERGCPGLRNRTPGGIGQHGQRRHVGVLALIGCHTLRGVALHMLDRAEVFHHRLFHIFHADIVLEIEPGTPFTRHMPERGKTIGIILCLRHIGGCGFAQRLGHTCSNLCPIAQTGSG